MAGPTGIGLYLRALRTRKYGQPEELARRFADHGVSWVAIGGPWHEANSKRWINRPANIPKWAEAFGVYGIEAHVWGYPWHNRVEEFVEDMLACSRDYTPDGWLLDPELGFKRYPEEALELFHTSRAALASLNKIALLGMTSYGIPKGHRSFPFESFAKVEFKGHPLEEVDYGSPQLYYLPEKRVQDGLDQWEELGFDEIVPSFGNYKFVQKDPNLPNSPRNRRAVAKTGPELDTHLGHFIDSDVPIRGMIGWAHNFVTRAQWVVLRKWADRLARGACMLESLE